MPRFLVENLKRTQEIFPSIKVHLIHNQKKVTSIKNVSSHFFDISKNKSIVTLDKHLKHPKDFRKNFWMVSIARFIAVAEFQKKIMQKIVLIESDVVLSSDFPFDKLEKLYKEKVAFPIISNERGVASTVYFGSAQISNLLSEFSLEQVKLNNQTTDMLILKKFYDKYSNLVGILPTCIIEKENLNEHTPDGIFQDMYTAQSFLEGVFDGSDLGWYFFGNNPYNGRGLKTRFMKIENDFCLPEIYNLKVNIARKFYSLKQSDKELDIFSLHFTNKQPKYFKNPVIDGNINPRLGSSKSLVLGILFKIVISAFLRRIKCVIIGRK